MSNWTIITIADLKASGHGAIVDKAQTTAAGSTDPVVEEIANAVARVRRAVATGNDLDLNPAKIPNSLKGVAVRIAVYALYERIRFPLSADQSETRRNDQSDLKRIADSRQRVEAPDTPAGAGEMQGQPGPRITPRTRNFTDRTTDGI